MNTYAKTRSARHGAWTAILIVIAVIAFAMLTTSCQSKSGQLLENRISERCIVIDTYTINENNAYEPTRTYLKVLRVSDNTIHGQLTHHSKLYECGDTLLLPFDKRYDY